MVSGPQMIPSNSITCHEINIHTVGAFIASVLIILWHVHGTCRFAICLPDLIRILYVLSCMHLYREIFQFH